MPDFIRVLQLELTEPHLEYLRSYKGPILAHDNNAVMLNDGLAMLSTIDEKDALVNTDKDEAAINPLYPRVNDPGLSTFRSKPYSVRS